MAKQFIDCKVYDLNGVFIENHTLGRAIRSIIFEDPATVSLVAPYKKVIVDADVSINEDLVNEIEVKPEHYIWFTNEPRLDPVNWVSVGPKLQGTLSPGAQLYQDNALENFRFHNKNEFIAGANPPSEPKKLNPNFVTIPTYSVNMEVTEAQSLANYIELPSFAYVKKNFKSLLMSLTTRVIVYSDFADNYSEKENENFYYDAGSRCEILLNGSVVFSTFRDHPALNVTKTVVGPTVSEFSSIRYLDFEINLTDFRVQESGYLSLRVYLPKQKYSNDAVGWFVLKDFSLNLKKSYSESLVINRPIPFTSVFDTSLSIISSETNITTDQLYLDTSVPSKTEISIYFTRELIDGKVHFVNAFCIS